MIDEADATLARALTQEFLVACELPSSIESYELFAKKVIAAARVRDERWEDISSAPKDGTRILVLCPHARIFSDIHIDWWSDGPGKPRWAQSSPNEQPKFWREIPAGPGQS